MLATFVVVYKFLGIPNESNLFQHLFSIVGQRGMFVSMLELILMTLSFDPLGQLEIVRVSVGYNTPVEIASLVIIWARSWKMNEN